MSSYDLKASTEEGHGTLSVTTLELLWGVEPALSLCLWDSTDSGSAPSTVALPVRTVCEGGHILLLCYTHGTRRPVC